MTTKECMDNLYRLKTFFETRSIIGDPEAVTFRASLDLAMDIIYSQEGEGSDTEHLKRLVEHFETCGKPKLNHQLGVYQCPSCGGRVRLHQGYCQRCGKKLEADRPRKRRKGS